MSMDVITSMSGLDYMRGVRDGTLPAVPILEHFGFCVTEVDEGRISFEGTPQAHHLNPMQSVHGGWYGTILDSALGCSVMSKLPKGTVYTTLEYKVNLIRAIRPGQTMRASATAGHVGRSTGVATAELYGVEDGRLYATASTTCLVMSLPEPG